MWGGGVDSLHVKGHNNTIVMWIPGCCGYIVLHTQSGGDVTTQVSCYLIRVL